MEKTSLLKNLCFLLLGMLCSISAYSQTLKIQGKVTSADGPIPGATVMVKGTNNGTATSVDGVFELSTDAKGTLVVSAIGYATQEVPINNQQNLTITIAPTSQQLGEVVVTALGISREKQSLGYATQEVTGDDVSRVKTGNVTNALSGKVAGVQVRRNTRIGGSANVIIRGNNSLTGDNQALFVIDGVPVDNTNTTTSNNSYDYGNAAADINPDDIESVNVLKGAAATALYGSRAANGAIIITTKKGANKTGIGVTISSGVIVGYIDKSTFPQFQQEYGAGYGRVNGPGGTNYFNSRDVNGDGVLDLVAPYDQYAGWGAPYDPNLMVYQWNSVSPLSPNYLKPTPWVAPENGPLELFQNPVTLNNNVSLAGTTDKATYRFSYTNFSQGGIVPNSDLKRNNFALNSSFKLTDKLTASGSANYSITDVRGRTEGGTGSGFSSIMTNIRQYWQPNIDFKELGTIYEQTGRNITQFPGGTIDNPFYLLDQNRQSDSRNRLIGNASLQYNLFDWLNVLGRVSMDTYTYLQEERQNTLIRVPARYTNRNIFFKEINYDLMLNYNKDITEKFNVSGVFGTNIRRNNYRSIYNATNGGLIVEGLYAISNSLGAPPAAQEVERNLGVDGVYGSVSLGYNNMLYVDVTGRSDRSSTLPAGNNTFFYPSVATSFVFSELLKNDFFSFGKLRLNYAEVGNSAPALSLTDVLSKPTPFGTTQLYSVNNTKNNPNLKPENTVSLEAGLETFFFGRRLGFNLSAYKTNTKDQIMPVVISPATGYTNRYVNAGEVQNKGLEISLTGSPVATSNFSWNATVNWSKNRSKIVSLYEGVSNLQLYATGTQNVTLNARVGQPYGVWYGSNFIYLNGERVINQKTGAYEKTSTSDQIIGNMLPDWNGGINNAFTYKNFGLSFLIDMQKGGDIFSSDMAIGTKNGLYENTTGTNDLGNPVRNRLEDGGGIILEGVAPDGSVNTVRTSVLDRNTALGSPIAPDALFMYDASYVKLRELAFSYNLPSKILSKTFLTGVQFSVIGSNLWIIHKNVPYADPEAGLGAGNVQGHQQGVFPSTRDIGFNVRLQF